MRKTFFVFLISFVMFQVLGQGSFYIYIQSADHKPFYVRTGDRVFYSSGNGYLVIDDLKSNTYNLAVGFTNESGTEWHFSCTVNDEDKAFILKNNNGKKVELSSLKNDEKQAGKKVEVKTEKINTVVVKKATGVVSEDPFSAMLSEVVDDPTIRQQPVIIPRPGDSLKLVKTQIPDSVKLTAVNPVKTKEPAAANSLTDSQSLAKTTNVLPKTVPGKKTEKRKIVAIPAVVENKTGKYKASDKISVAVPSKITENVLSVVKTLVPPIKSEPKHEELKIKTSDSASVAVAAASRQKETEAGKTISSVSEPSPSSQLINAAFEEAEKKKQSANGSGTEKNAIVLGNSTSIKKTLQRRSREGIELIYIDEMDNGHKDTIRILIPSDN